MPDTFYICDKRACGDVCPNGMCEYTSDVTHAVNFKGFDGKYAQTGRTATAYFEKEPTMDEIKTTIENPGAVVDPIETKEIAMTHEEEQKAWNETERRYEKKPLTEEQKADRRFWNFLEMVYKLARMSGLYIEGHIKVRDKRTGKVWE